LEIVVASGKGGVGKTTLSSSFSLLFFKKGFEVVAVDADVAAPNLALLLCRGGPFEKREIRVSKKAVIDYGKCINCGLCVENCVFGAIERKGKPVVIEQMCEGCGACTLVCPEGAISFKARRTGFITINSSRFGFPVVSGELELGERNTGLMVFEVKSEGRRRASENGVLIVDGAPGIGCPVIASIVGANYLVGVTEPTPEAFRNLRRLREVARHFGVKMGVVINNCDLNTVVSEEIKSWVLKENLDFLGEIPHDLEVVKAAVNLKTIIEFNSSSKASKAIKEIFNRLLEVVGFD